MLERGNPFVSYEKLPDLFRKYSIYLDIRIRNGLLLKALSKTGLEALASGLTVMNYNNQMLEGLPLMHSPEYVVSKLEFLYKKINTVNGIKNKSKRMKILLKNPIMSFKLFRMYRKVLLD